MQIIVLSLWCGAEWGLLSRMGCEQWCTVAGLASMGTNSLAMYPVDCQRCLCTVCCDPVHGMLDTCKLEAMRLLCSLREWLGVI